MTDAESATQDLNAPASRLALDADMHDFTDGYSIDLRIDDIHFTLTHPETHKQEEMDPAHREVIMFSQPTKLTLRLSHWDKLARTILVAGTVGEVLLQIYLAYLQPLTAEELAQLSWYSEEHGELTGVDLMGDMRFYEGMWQTEKGYHIRMGS